MINPIKFLIQKYKETCVIPSNMRNVNTETSLFRLKFTTIPLIFLGLIRFISVFFFTNPQSPQYHYSLIYYSCVFVISIFLSFMSIFLTNKNISYKIKTIPLFMAIIFYGTLAALITYIPGTSFFSGLVLLGLLGLLIVVLFTPEPIIFFITEFLLFLVMSYKFYKEGDFHQFLNVLLVSFVIGILVFYKRKTLVNQYKQEYQFNTQNAQLQIYTEDLKTQEEELLRLKQLLESDAEVQSEKLLQQNKKLIELQNHTILNLSNLVENRDKDTGKHVLRTREYVKFLAEQTRNSGYYTDIITDRYILLLEKAAPMHDIGKIIIPDTVLKKPGKLTEEEFEQIKQHTVQGGKIVYDVLGKAEDPDYVKITEEIAHFHHEKWNGKGYPECLQGENIPLSARLMALADVYDALVSERCYKDPMPDDKAFKIIEEGIGEHFDPILAKIFLLSKNKIIDIKRQYAD